LTNSPIDAKNSFFAASDSGKPALTAETAERFAR